MRILLDVSPLERPGSDRGSGRYVRRLRSAVQSIPNVDVTEYAGWKGIGGQRWVEWIELPHRALAVGSSGRRLYHASSVYQLVPLLLDRSVVSVQDIIPLELPEYLRTGAKAKVFHSLAKKCRAVLVQSSHTAERVENVLGVPPEKITVCPLPVALSGTVPGVNCNCEIGELPATYVSTVADVVTVDPRKRLPWLFALAAALESSGIGFVLVGTGTERLRSPNVTGLGRLCDHHLGKVMEASLCFVYASAYEGQGLPPQEALSVGVPVVALRNTSLPEMLGPGALWVDEARSTSLAEPEVRSDRDQRVRAMEIEVLRLAGDHELRAATAAAGQAYVGRFTEARFAATLEDVYRRVVDG
jgi:glycosyltransferase involved in cell wall biosynthesis